MRPRAEGGLSGAHPVKQPTSWTPIGPHEVGSIQTLPMVRPRILADNKFSEKVLNKPVVLSAQLIF
jgi:hypothetical protein